MSVEENLKRQRAGKVPLEAKICGEKAFFAAKIPHHRHFTKSLTHNRNERKRYVSSWLRRETDSRQKLFCLPVRERGRRRRRHGVSRPSDGTSRSLQLQGETRGRAGSPGASPGFPKNRGKNGRTQGSVWS